MCQADDLVFLANKQWANAQRLALQERIVPFPTPTVSGAHDGVVQRTPGHRRIGYLRSPSQTFPHLLSRGRLSLHVGYKIAAVGHRHRRAIRSAAPWPDIARLLPFFNATRDLQQADDVVSLQETLLGFPQWGFFSVAPFAAPGRRRERAQLGFRGPQTFLQLLSLLGRQRFRLDELPPLCPNNIAPASLNLDFCLVFPLKFVPYPQRTLAVDNRFCERRVAHRFFHPAHHLLSLF